ncbi:MAG: 6,7-dimethyl-8-ribityllumazine synthase [Candidatus Thermoplasmatota archaeon]
MAPDDKALERRLKAQEEAAQRMAKATDPDAANAHLFEEFKRPTQPGEAPKPKGLNAQGYQFPPPVGQPALTKENLAKGVGLPPSGNIVPPMPPPTELVATDPLFEEYQRPDLKHNPRTGTGLRNLPPQPKSAKEILAAYEPPTPQVFTGKRLDPPAPIALPPTPAPIIQPARPTPMPSQSAAELDAAHLDAEADLASAPELTMSHSRAHGPMKTVTDHDPFAEMPTLPGTKAKASAPAETKASSTPHANDAPPVEPGDGPRIGLVQADFNYGITTRMAQAARTAAEALGCTVVHHAHVAGVYDVPLAAKVLARRDDVDAIVAVGCVIQGETGHDQLIAQECARKLADLSYDSEKPVGLAVTGPRMTRQAAEARVDTAPRNAVEAVVKQWRTLKALHAARLAAH